MSLSQKQQRSSINFITQVQLLQSLSFYFSAPSPKPLPYQKQIINNSIMILKYIFPFIANNRYNRQIISKCLQFLVDQKRKTIQNIIYLKEIKKNDQKLLFNRYLSLYSTITNFNGNNGVQNNLIKIKNDQEKLFIKIVLDQICVNLSNNSEQNQIKNLIQVQVLIQIINKIILVGHSELLFSTCLIKSQQSLGNNYILETLCEYFHSIVKPHKIIIYLIQNNLQNLWREIVYSDNQENIKTVAKCLSNVLNSIQMKQNYAQVLLSLIYEDKQKEVKESKIKIINQNKALEPIKQSIKTSILTWWTKSNDDLITKQNAQFKTNILAILVQKYLSKQQVIESQYTIYLSQGIQKRMPKADYLKKAAIIIWVRFAKKLNFEENVKDYVKEADLFQPTKQILNNQRKQDIQQNNNMKIVASHQKNQNSLKQFSNQQQQKSNIQQFNQDSSVFQEDMILIKPPKNIYDCILGLKNQSRRKITLKYLPSIMLKHSDDLALSWLDLSRALIHPLYDQNKQSLVVLFTLKPLQVINLFSERFFKGDCTIHERVVLMDVIRSAVEQLASNPKIYQRNIEVNQDKDFFFEKVKSKYYNEKSQQQKEKQSLIKQKQLIKQSKTRRWGHTRIQHQKRFILSTSYSNNTNTSLLIVNNDPYINRLYEIVNAVFFKMISKLPNSSILLKSQEFSQALLILFSAFIQNIKNHFQKYSIISEIINILLTLLKNYKQKETKNIMNCIQVLLKTSMVIDRYIPQTLLICITQCLKLLMERKQYGINHFLQAIQENIYSNMKINTSLY